MVVIYKSRRCSSLILKPFLPRPRFELRPLDCLSSVLPIDPRGRNVIFLKHGVYTQGELPRFNLHNVGRPSGWELTRQLPTF